MRTRGIAASAGLALAALSGCSPPASETAGTPATCLPNVNKAFVDGVRNCEARVAQADERARQAYERGLPPEPVPVLDIPPLGVVLPGAPWSAVKDFRRSDDCAVEPDHVDCLVTDTRGVEYLVFDTSISTVTARASSASSQVSLPFTLAFGDPAAVTLSKLIDAKVDMSWLVNKPSGGNLVVNSAEDFKGADGLGFALILTFEQDRLVEVKYYRQVI